MVSGYEVLWQNTQSMVLHQGNIYFTVGVSSLRKQSAHVTPRHLSSGRLRSGSGLLTLLTHPCRRLLYMPI